MAVINVSDNFNRADETLNKVGGNWVCSQTIRPNIVSNQLTTAASVTSVWKDRNPGVQYVKATFVALASITNKGGLVFGVPATAVLPGTAESWNTGEAFYTVRVRTGDVQLIKKDAAPSTSNTVLATYSPDPAAGDVYEAEYDPATGVINVWATGTNTPTRALAINYTDPSPLTGQGIGVYQENATTVDTWSGSWTTVDAPPPASQAVTDDFNRANSWIGATAAWESTSSTNPQIINNRLESASSGTAVHTTKYSGKQTVEATLISNANIGTIRSSIVAGIQDVAPSFSSEPWYRIGVRAADYVLQVKANGTSSHSTVTATGNPYAPAGGPQSGDRLRLTYDPDTGTVEMFVSAPGGGTPVLRASATLPTLGATHTRVGIGTEVGNIMDDFSASWNTSDPVATGWKFYELQGDLTTELPLFLTEWNGTSETPINLTATTVVGDTGVPSPFPLKDVYHSDRLLESFGVGTAYNRDKTYYGNNASTVTSYLSDLGARYIRDRVFAGDVTANNMTYLNAVAALGIKASLVTMAEDAAGGSDLTTTEKNNIFNWIEANKSKVSNIQGWNEPNKGDTSVAGNQLSSSWALYVKNHQKTIYDEFIARGLHNYQHSGAYGEKMYVQGPALMDDNGADVNITDGPNGAPAYANLRAVNIAPHMHRGNWHRYPLQSQQPTVGGVATYPENNPEREQWASDTYGGKELDWTEYGFYIGSVDETTRAIYHPRMIIHNFLGSTHRTFLYELLESGTTGVKFGIVRVPSPTSPGGWYPSPAFNSIKDLLIKFKDVTTTAYNPPQIGMALEYTDDNNVGQAANGGLRYGIFEYQNARSNGVKKFLVMWRLMRLHTTSNARVTVPTMNVTVKTDGTPNGLVVPVNGFPIAVNINSSNTIVGTENLTPTW